MEKTNLQFTAGLKLNACLATVTFVCPNNLFTA
jgi:hypothetical protein